MSFLPLQNELKPNQVQLWLIDEGEVMSAGLLEDCRMLLSRRESEQVATFKSVKRQQQFIITRAALRSLLSAHLVKVQACDIEIEADEFGKPKLVSQQTPLQFNISHSRDKVVIALTSSQRIGVDIEHLNKNRNVFKIAAEVFHPQEWHAESHSSHQDSTNLFYTLWTLKEAYIKAEGMGLTVPLNQFYFDLSTPHKPKLIKSPAIQAGGSNWLFRCLTLSEDYGLALALEDFGIEQNIDISAYNYIPLHSALPIPHNCLNIEQE